LDDDKTHGHGFYNACDVCDDRDSLVDCNVLEVFDDFSAVLFISFGLAWSLVPVPIYM
jgi:hypothetical protein